MSDGPTQITIARFWPVISAVSAFGLVIALAALLVYRQNLEPFSFELEWMEEVIEERTGLWTALALTFDIVGGGLIAIIVIPLLIIASLILWRRPWAALYFAISAAVAAGLVQLIKNLVGRPRPPEMLVQPDFGSFPSGHSANAAVIATVLGIIFSRVWVWAVGAVITVLMMLSRTYLGVHWVSDTVGGLLLGIGVAVIVWAPFAYLLHRERQGAHPLWRRRTGPGEGDTTPKREAGVSVEPTRGG